VSTRDATRLARACALALAVAACGAGNGDSGRMRALTAEEVTQPEGWNDELALTDA
jgi:hypothetical protein